MEYVPNILFCIALVIGGGLFTINIRKIIRNIKLGRDADVSGSPAERFKVMALVALGQSKMFSRPVAAFMHILIYVGFIIINVEVLEIIIDGIFGTHRVFAKPLGPVYDFLIASFEILAAAVLLACVVFFARRNFMHIGRFRSSDLKGQPSSDANIILITEVLLMSAFLMMNGADQALQILKTPHYEQVGSYPVSSLLLPILQGLNPDVLMVLERFGWWFHILGILCFLNYLPYSKHFHIMLAFPNTYYSKLTARGRMTNLDSVTKEVKLMLDPSADPYAAPADPNAAPVSFGARDVKDLTWKQLMDAYSCTECGRCTSECPANGTGKLLSPRKIMMSTRDRLEEVGKNIDTHGSDFTDNKSLLHDYITPEELWACTTCNACAEVCPVNIDPVSIIIDLRRSLVMEESAAPGSLNAMFTNIENNMAPWQFSPADRLNWKDEA
jgi:ferredoxin